jgi:nucleoid-associated protein YgaU
MFPMRGCLDTRHIVKTGDTLEKISMKYYGDEFCVRLIIEANSFEHKDALTVGQRIIIPARKGER